MNDVSLGVEAVKARSRRKPKLWVPVAPLPTPTTAPVSRALREGVEGPLTPPRLARFQQHEIVGEVRPRDPRVPGRIRQ